MSQAAARGAGGGRPGTRSGRYTVIVVGDHSDPVTRFALSRRTIRSAVLFLALLAVGLAVAGLYAASLARDGTRWRLVEQENASLRAQLDAVRERLAHISTTLDQVEARDGSLRSTLKQLQVPDAASPALPGKRKVPREPPPGPTGALSPPAVEGPVLPAALSGALSRLALVAARQDASLQEVGAYFDAQRTLLASSPSAWPTRGLVTSDFGVRLDPYTASRVMHRGLDIATPVGQAVYAPSEGVVAFAGTEQGYGKVVEVDHGHGVRTRFGHLSEIYVKRGERVGRGARLGSVGSTGRSTGPHLHYEVLVNGTADNPRKFMLE